MTINVRRIETILAERGLTRKELAESCGICAQNVSTVLKRGTCSPRTVGKLARGLEVTVADIIEERS